MFPAEAVHKWELVPRNIPRNIPGNIPGIYIPPWNMFSWNNSWEQRFTTRPRLKKVLFPGTVPEQFLGIIFTFAHQCNYSTTPGCFSSPNKYGWNICELSLVLVESHKFIIFLEIFAQNQLRPYATTTFCFLFLMRLHGVSMMKFGFAWLQELNFVNVVISSQITHITAVHCLSTVAGGNVDKLGKHRVMKSIKKIVSGTFPKIVKVFHTRLRCDGGVEGWMECKCGWSGGMWECFYVSERKHICAHIATNEVDFLCSPENILYTHNEKNYEI